MESHGVAGMIGIVFGGVFLLLALFSTVSRITLVNLWWVRAVNYERNPTAFICIVFCYWLLGLVGVAAGIFALAKDWR